METHDPIKTTTEGQIDKAVAAYRVMLTKHAPFFSAEAVQAALGSRELAKGQFNLFRTRVEAASKLITRTAKVDRSRTRMQAMLATGRTLRGEDFVLSLLPQGADEEVTMTFYPGLDFRAGQVGTELRKLGFELVMDPIGQAAVNEDDPEFADAYPNCTEGGRSWSVTFFSWCNHRRVTVGRNPASWGGTWWYPVRPLHGVL